MDGMTRETQVRCVTHSRAECPEAGPMRSDLRHTQHGVPVGPRRRVGQRVKWRSPAPPDRLPCRGRTPFRSRTAGQGAIRQRTIRSSLRVVGFAMAGWHSSGGRSARRDTRWLARHGHPCTSVVQCKGHIRPCRSDRAGFGRGVETRSHEVGIDTPRRLRHQGGPGPRSRRCWVGGTCTPDRIGHGHPRAVPTPGTGGPQPGRDRRGSARSLGWLPSIAASERDQHARHPGGQ